ncbi:MAG: hypothetical protein GY714_04640 [Desulfobacterales bacterium]|nr:hypothetical protein [Desulfobacterales bacterium]MCP4161516.1 hypothetical protein [Deltaproteobacteria bacterium]
MQKPTQIKLISCQKINDLENEVNDYLMKLNEEEVEIKDIRIFNKEDDWYEAIIIYLGNL